MDWTMEAAKAIWEVAWAHRLYPAPEARMAAIIAEHCPYKPGVEYWEAPKLDGVHVKMIDDVQTLQRMLYATSHSLGASRTKLGEQRRKARARIDELTALLKESRREHGRDGDDDPCEKVNYLDGLHACTCGADAWNARVDAALREE